MGPNKMTIIMLRWAGAVALGVIGMFLLGVHGFTLRIFGGGCLLMLSGVLITFEGPATKH